MAIDDKTKREVLIVLILLVVFLAVLFMTLRSTGIMGRTQNAPTTASTDTQDRTAPEALSASRQPVRTASEPVQPQADLASQQPDATDFRYTAKSLRDPLISLLPKEKPEQPASVQEAEKPPLAVAKAEAPDLDIQGMIWGGSRPQALIGGRLYGVGDEIEGARIVSIDRSGVSVDVRGETFRLGVPAATAQSADARKPQIPGWQPRSGGAKTTSSSYPWR